MASRSAAALPRCRFSQVLRSLTVARRLQVEEVCMRERRERAEAK